MAYVKVVALSTSVAEKEAAVFAPTSEFSGRLVNHINI
jgi:hypothetical protein